MVSIDPCGVQVFLYIGSILVIFGCLIALFPFTANTNDINDSSSQTINSFNNFCRLDISLKVQDSTV